jgi:putative MFS transporter
MLQVLKQKLVWIAAFGYFVDLFDLVLYGVVRVDSLKSLGYNNYELFQTGAYLLNIQMAGMMVGGFMWGILGDRRGRREALFGSILIYSIATFLNAYVHSFAGYAALRFLAGLGLAGELGAAITIVSEVLPAKTRGYGSAFIAAIGFVGAICASYFGQHVSWQNAYRIGGLLGLLLLGARMSIPESALYISSRRESKDPNAWGSIGLLFGKKNRLRIFLWALVVGVPIWFVAGILSYFAPELAKNLGTVGEVTAGTSIMLGYLGSIVGDVICGVMSQVLKSRKRAIQIFLIVGGSIAVFHPFFLKGGSSQLFYAVMFAVGLGNGFSAILVAWVAEIYGTNLRNTAATTLANLMRAAVIPLTLSFSFLRPHFGMNNSTVILGAICFGGALYAVTQLPETFAKELSFLEL